MDPQRYDQWWSELISRSPPERPPIPAVYIRAFANDPDDCLTP